MRYQVAAERPQSRQRFTIFLSIRRRLARDNVVDMANGKPGDIHTALPCIRKPLDSFRRKYEVQVERTVFELNEIHAARHFAGFSVV